MKDKGTMFTTDPSISVILEEGQIDSGDIRVPSY